MIKIPGIAISIVLLFCTCKEDTPAENSLCTEVIYDSYTVRSYADLWKKLIDGHPDFDTINKYTDHNYYTFSGFLSSNYSSKFLSGIGDEKEKNPAKTATLLLQSSFEKTGLSVAETKAVSGTLTIKRNKEEIYQVKLRVHLGRICYKNFCSWMNIQTDILELKGITIKNQPNLKYAFEVIKADTSISSDFIYSHAVSIETEQNEIKVTVPVPVHVNLSKLHVTPKGEIVFEDDTPFRMKLYTQNLNDQGITFEYSGFKPDK